MANDINIFANLIGRGKPKVSDGSDGEKDEDATAEEAALEDDDGAESGGGDDDASDGSAESDDEQAAYARGRAAERARISTILSHASVGPHNIAQAAQIATATDLSPGAAASVLGAASQEGSLSARLARHDTALVPAGDGGQTKELSLKERAESRRKKR
ncbi:MAG: hypothetical protein AAF334_00090 [Pseudomonadota bacterium]